MFRFPQFVLYGLALLAALGTAGCGIVGPNYTGPPPTPLAGFQHRIEGPQNPARWSAFNDPILGQLFKVAIQQNPTLKQTLWRIAESRETIAIVSGQRDPFVDAFKTQEIRKRSSNSQAFVGDNADPFNFVSLGLDSRWEIDLYGRIQRETEAATADYEASVEEAADVRRILLGDIARAYVEVRLYQNLAKQNLANARIQESSLPFVKTRIEAGKVTELDLVQLQSRVSLTKSDTPAFDERYQLALNRLAILLGQPPSESLKAFIGSSSQLASPGFSTGVPAELLRRRPDIRRQERLIAAASPRIGVAEAELYPRLGLSGIVSLDGRDITDLFEVDSILFGIGPTFSWNILSLGRIERAIDVRHAQFQQAVFEYKQTVLTAIAEVENALVSYHQSGKRVTILENAKEEAAKAVRLATQQYEADRVSLERVVSNQRRLLRISLELERVQADLALSSVNLIQALGGDDSTDSVPATAHAPPHPTHIPNVTSEIPGAEMAPADGESVLLNGTPVAVSKTPKPLYLLSGFSILNKDSAAEVKEESSALDPGPVTDLGPVTLGAPQGLEKPLSPAGQTGSSTDTDPTATLGVPTFGN